MKEKELETQNFYLVKMESRVFELWLNLVSLETNNKKQLVAQVVTHTKKECRMITAWVWLKV